MVGLPAPGSAAKSIPAGAQLDQVTPFITPNDKFYRVDISLVTPRVEIEGWSLTIDGMVDKPLQLSYADLLKLPMIERNITLTCVSNEVGGPYVSTSKWLGVPFAEIIKLVGVQPGVEQVYSYSSDSGYTCSTPYQAVSDGRDAMIVVAMNGEPLPDAHGFPARMLVPGLFGFVSATKWLSRIEFTTYAKRSAYWTDRKWATDAPILTQSRIDVPKSLSTVPKDKAVIAGVAWAQHRGIDKVEIKIDDDDWRETKLAESAGIDLWRQWSYVYDGPAGTAQRTGPGDRSGRRDPARTADEGVPVGRDRLAPDPVHDGVGRPRGSVLSVLRQRLRCFARSAARCFFCSSTSLRCSACWARSDSASIELSRMPAAMAAMASDHSGEPPRTIGAVPIRQTSKPRNRLRKSPGGKAPAPLATIGTP